MRFLRVVLMLAVFVALGCEEPATGPTASEFNDKRDALQTRAVKQKGVKRPSVRVAKGQPSIGNIRFRTIK